MVSLEFGINCIAFLKIRIGKRRVFLKEDSVRWIKEH
jgi:hypothetical protein